jgi:hypothetical protein
MPPLPKDWNGIRRGLQNGIGEQLRATYDEFINEDIPAGHVDLLQRFGRNEASEVDAPHRLRWRAFHPHQQA